LRVAHPGLRENEYIDSDATTLTGTNGEEMSVRDRTLADPDRRARDRAILAAKRSGKTWRQVADLFDLGERQTRRAAKSAERLEAEYDLEQVDGPKVLSRIIAAQVRARDAIEHEMSAGDNSSARIGAARAAAQIGSELRNSLAAGGNLPGRTVNDLGVGAGNWVAWRREADGFLERVVEAIQQCTGVDREVAASVVDAVVEEQTNGTPS
jgi:hypothetical protein